MTEMQEFITKLAEGYSIQSKTTNRFWLVLIITSIIALVGRIDDKKLIELPFTLGRVHPADFYSITIILISVVVIAFSAAMTQAMRTRMLIQKAIDSLSRGDQYIGKIHIQDFFDSTVTPTYIRVAPISQFMLGKNQFFGMRQKNKWIRGAATILYIMLKVATFVFLYFIPIIALTKCWRSKDIAASEATLHIPGFLLIMLVVLAGTSMLVLAIGDIRHLVKVTRRVLR